MSLKEQTGGRLARNTAGTKVKSVPERSQQCLKRDGGWSCRKGRVVVIIAPHQSTAVFFKELMRYFIDFPKGPFVGCITLTLTRSQSNY